MTDIALKRTEISKLTRRGNRCVAEIIVAFNLAWRLFSRGLISSIILFGFLGPVSGDETEPILKIGDKIPAFNLKDFRGKSWKSSDFKSKALVVVFFGVECPLVKQYSIRLGELQKEFGGDFQLVGINSNRHDSIKEIEYFSKLVQADQVPLLKDPANRIADAFGARRTPEVFLFDSKQQLVYNGAIDDQYSYGLQKPQANKRFLHDAVTATLAGKKPEVERTQTDGCIIGRILASNKSSEVTYAKQISRILNDRCVKCHRTGEVAPFSLTDYDEVVGWAEMIQEVVGERRMPPWHANPNHGKFKNDVSLSKQQIDSINTWVSNGAPFGDKADLPEPPQFTEGWQIGQPDVVIPMAKTPFKVPATGEVKYQYFQVDPGFKEDKWVRSAELRIGNRAVVHHIIVGTTNGRRAASHGQIQSEWLTATAPGAKPLELPEGYAKLIPAGAKLVFQMHYTPNGTPQTDISSVGFIFTDAKTVRKSVGTVEVRNRRFEIPPGAANHPVSATKTLRRDTLLLALFPHMHLRGKSFKYIAKMPGEADRVLLDVPNFDFNWQNGYEFETPVLLPRGTVIECQAVFDNSENNLANPNPRKRVRWGDQTWEEMMIGYLDMALADQDLTKKRE
ncbi:MAG: redoxin domain-containing protein [Mariniblastus sp.]|nr:redoxin domain-containing protein [Mariniblastus sp.]